VEDDKKTKEKDHKLENYFDCLSPKATQWKTISSILRPEIRFMNNLSIKEGQEFEVSPISKEYLHINIKQVLLTFLL
jgi:hypothetical protein